MLGFVHIDHIRADAENLRARLMNSSYVAKEDLIVSNDASATRRVVDSWCTTVDVTSIYFPQSGWPQPQFPPLDEVFAFAQ